MYSIRQKVDLTEQVQLVCHGMPLRLEGVQHYCERESSHASGKHLPPARGTTGRCAEYDSGSVNINSNWHAACRLYGHYEENDVFLAEPARVRCFY